MSVTSAEAEIILDATEKEARRLGISVIVAVLDDGAHLKSFRRMDGAVLGSIDIAIRKARTAVLFRCNSEDVWDYLKPGAAAPHLELSNGGLAPYGGGMVLLIAGDAMAGAIGISGGSIEQDTQVARAAHEAFRAARR